VNEAFELGKLFRDPQTGLMISKGLTVRRFASSGAKIRFESTYATTQYSNKKFHFDPDGATCLTTKDGGWAYVSNSENTRGPGGVYSLLFDKFGKAMDYIAVLENTRRNCAGGKTPWNTWISCEEWKRGQCFQCHPTEKSHNPITLGGPQGGNFEAFVRSVVDSSQALPPCVVIIHFFVFVVTNKYVLNPLFSRIFCKLLILRHTTTGTVLTQCFLLLKIPHLERFGDFGQGNR
jgi:hypothetical protein